MEIVLIGAGVALLVLLGYIIGQYNGLIALRNHMTESWSDIDTELKRRYELVPNLVACVKAYAAHEREVLDRVTQLRARCSSDHGSPTRQSATESQLSAALRQMFVTVERYPELKADKNFLHLQEELVTTENRIQAARRFFNGNVRDYRNKRECFPSSIIATAFHFGEAEFFEVEPSVRELPRLPTSS